MPDVLFLPGFMQHADAWSEVAALVGERYPSRVLDFETWTFEERVGEILAASVPGTIPVGYSMGARLALHAVVRTPNRFAGLVMVGGTAGIEDEGVRRARLLADEELASWIETHSIDEVVERWERNPVFASQSSDVVAAQRAGRLRHSPADLARLLRSAGQGALPPVWDRLRELRTPVLALAGADDSSYKAVAERLANLGPVFDVAVIENAGHAAHLEQPAAVAEAILAFVAKLIRP